MRIELTECHEVGYNSNHMNYLALCLFYSKVLHRKDFFFSSFWRELEYFAFPGRKKNLLLNFLFLLLRLFLSLVVARSFTIYMSSWFCAILVIRRLFRKYLERNSFFLSIVGIQYFDAIFNELGWRLPAYKYFKIYSINFNYCHLLFSAFSSLF